MSTVAPVSNVSSAAAVTSHAAAPTPPVAAAAAPTAVTATAPVVTASTATISRNAPELQAQLDRTLADSQTSLQFRVEEDIERVVVTVLDGSGEKIIQIPSEAALKIARALADTGRGLFDDEA